MPTVCRLLRLPSDHVASLSAQPGGLAQSVESAKIFSDVYRDWHAIQYLLAQHRPTPPAARWLSLGQELSTGTIEIPAARLLRPEEVASLDSALRDIEPEDLVPYYDADALDQADIYPQCWKAWEETFDRLGQVLEHFSFLQSFANKCAALISFSEPLRGGRHWLPQQKGNTVGRTQHEPEPMSEALTSGRLNRNRRPEIKWRTRRAVPSY